MRTLRLSILLVVCASLVSVSGQQAPITITHGPILCRLGSTEVGVRAGFRRGGGLGSRRRGDNFFDDFGLFDDFGRFDHFGLHLHNRLHNRRTRGCGRRATARHNEHREHQHRNEQRNFFEHSSPSGKLFLNALNVQWM